MAAAAPDAAGRGRLRAGRGGEQRDCENEGEERNEESCTLRVSVRETGIGVPPEKQALIFEAFTQAASRQKWLECHGLEHWTHFYTDYGRELQRRFFDHFLKDEQNGWPDEPPVLLQVRRPGERFEARAEHEWPLARTRWTRLYLDAAHGSLGPQPGA